MGGGVGRDGMTMPPDLMQGTNRLLNVLSTICALPSGISGWWLIEKTGLSERLLTMLQTATNGSYNLPDVVPALLRLS